jgi:hypothetical protein
VLFFYFVPDTTQDRELPIIIGYLEGNETVCLSCESKQTKLLVNLELTRQSVEANVWTRGTSRLQIKLLQLMAYALGARPQLSNMRHSYSLGLTDTGYPDSYLVDVTFTIGRYSGVNSYP